MTQRTPPDFSLNERTLYLEILGIPGSKQSARYYSKGGKVFSYQPQKVKDMERNIAYDVKSQLPRGFVPFDEPIFAWITYVFPIPKSLKKSDREKIKQGVTVYKSTKPDVNDNLTKGVADSMEGIVFINDSRISRIFAEKIYGEVPRTIIHITPLTKSVKTD